MHDSWRRLTWPQSVSVELIDAAQAKLNPHRVGDRLLWNVAAALETTAGNVHVAVCIDTGSGTGFCAGHVAIASMVTAGGPDRAYRRRVAR